MFKLSEQKLAPSLLKLALLVLIPFGVSACRQSSSPVPTAAEIEAAKTQPAITGAPEIAKINAKGGTKIYAVVNGQPITTNDIKRRQAFVRLRRMKGNSRTIATDELVSEAIKMQEARRINSVVSDKEVNSAYARFAKNNRMSVSNLTQVLNKSGVTPRGFKEFIKSQMSWQRAVGVRLRSNSRGGGTGSGTKNVQSWLPAKGQGTVREQEYTLQQIVFIIPKSQRSQLLKARRAQANNFKKRMDGCTNAKALATSLRNVTVLDRGRTLASKLPPQWAKEIIATPVGKVTSIKETDRGLEMLAICKTREVIGQSTGGDDLFSDKGFQTAASKLEKEYYDEIKKRAIIKKR